MAVTTKTKTPSKTKQQVVTNPTSAIQLPIADILDEYLSVKRSFVGAFVGNDGKFARSRTFHMSGGGCARKDIAQLNDLPQIDENPTSSRRFATGKWVEQLLDKAMAWKAAQEGSNLRVITKQLKVWRDWAFRPGRGHKYDWRGRKLEWGPRLDLDDCLVTGSLDTILAYKSDRWRVFLIDWKTVDIRRFYKTDQEVDPGYATQLAGYYETTLDQYSEWLKQRFHEEGVELPEGAPLIDQARLIYAAVGGAMLIAQVGVSMKDWVPKVWERWRLQRANAEKYTATRQLPGELPVTEKGIPPWNCNPLYCRFALARTSQGPFVCPTVGEYWEGKIKELKDQGKDTEWPGRALEMGKQMVDPTAQVAAAEPQDPPEPDEKEEK